MSFWKQIAVAIVLLAAAAAGWAFFFPGASDVLARWGVEWARAATPPEQGAGERRNAQGKALQQAVLTAPVSVATINDRLSAIGTGAARNSVVVKPFSSGRLTDIAVKPGDRVSAGTVIARLDSDAEEIAVDRARLTLEDTKRTLTRIRTLRSANTATAVQVTEAELAVRNAELAVRDAELALERRAIMAPIAGIVGILPIDIGNHITADTQVATVDDRSSILVDFWVPERFASAIEIGADVSAALVARPEQVFEGRVSAVDNRIDEASRTLRVRAEIANPDDVLRAGMSFRVSMSFPGDRYPAVDPLAVQWGNDGAYVWVVRDGKAARTPVKIVQRNTDTVLVDGALRTDDVVVTEGMHAVREGQDVLIAGRESGNLAPAASQPVSGG